MAMIKISKGNMKMGVIPSFSLTPGRTCSAEACKTCFVQGCYACKSYRMYPNVRNAWDGNTEAVLNQLEEVEAELNAFFSKLSAPQFFRIHVAGDFVTKAYAEMWARVAEAHPRTRFLAFTKQWDNVRDVEFPENFSLILSDWPGCEIPSDLKHPIAYCVDTWEEAPEDAMHCPGHCDTCGACWDLKKSGCNVAFKKH